MKRAGTIRQLTALWMAVFLVCSTVVIHGAETETEEISQSITEMETEAVSEPVTEEATEAESEVITEEATEAVSELVTEEATEAESEVITEEATESESELVTEEATESESEQVTEEPTEEETEEASEPETECESESETEIDRTNFEILDEAGKKLELQEIVGPAELTCNGVTHPVDYAEGVYRVFVPCETKKIQISMQGAGEDAVQLTRWRGYLAEYENNWLLCPDDPMEKAFERDGNVYTVDLEKYQINPEELTMEQLTVYGNLKEADYYGEIFIYSPEISAVVLVEAETVSEPETESETETWTEAETETGTETKMQILPVEEVSVQAVTLEATPKETKDTYKAAGKNLADSAKEYTPKVSSINGEWQILGLARSEQEVDESVYTSYMDNVVNTVVENGGVLHKKKYTEYSRVILAVTAMGKDVTDVGGYNLLEPLADFDQTVWQGINGAIFALIAFDSHDYEIPAAPAGKTQTTRVKLINHILGLEISGGGWAMSGKKADPDVTGMAIQALAPYYDENVPVKNAVDRAVMKLSSMQLENGGYGSWGTVSSESCAQVIVALTALGIDPDKDPRFIKNGSSVVDALITYATADGAFKHVADGSADQMATEQAYYALTSYYRFLDGKPSLYDMSDVLLESDYEKAAAAEVLITALPSNITLQEESQVQQALTAYNALTDLQKSLVSEENTQKLQSAVNTINELSQEPETELSTGDETEKESESETEQITEKNPDSGKDKEKEKETEKETEEEKTPSGTTKKVNLVSNRTGATTIKKVNVSQKTETESETETETPEEETEIDVKISKDAEMVIAEMETLFEDSETGDGYSDVQMEAVLNVYRSYELLTGQDRKSVEESKVYEAFTEVLEKLGESNHYDEATGTDMRDNEEEILPWYVCLDAAPVLLDESQTEKINTALKGKGAVFSLNSIHLLNLLDGGEWSSEEILRVSIPMVDLGEYENAAVVHIRDDGTLEFLEAHISRENLEFDTDEFSTFGIIGLQGSLEELMEEEEADNLWVYALPGGAALAALLILLLIRRRISKKTV